MKAKFLTITFLFQFFLVFQINAQSFQPFVNSDKHWNVMYTDMTGGVANGASTIQYWISETDTIINDTTYKIVFSAGDVFADQGIPGFIREDTSTGKVYFRPHGYYAYPSVDRLIYDFSARTGDTVQVFGHLNCENWYDQDANVYRVTSTGDTTLLNGEVKKTWYLKSLSGYSESDIWIEDIGSLNGMLFPGCYMFGTISFNLDLLCYFKNGENLYISELDTCFVDWTTGVERINISQLKVYPNPANDFITIEMPEGFESAFKFEVLSSNGIQLMEGKQKGRSIDIQSLKPGFYYMRIITEKGSLFSKFIKL